jgi:hypothetical protein
VHGAILLADHGSASQEPADRPVAVLTSLVSSLVPLTVADRDSADVTDVAEHIGSIDLRLDECRMYEGERDNDADGAARDPAYRPPGDEQNHGSTHVSSLA